MTSCLKATHDGFLRPQVARANAKCGSGSPGSPSPATTNKKGPGCLLPDHHLLRKEWARVFSQHVRSTSEGTFGSQGDPLVLEDLAAVQ